DDIPYPADMKIASADGLNPDLANFLGKWEGMLDIGQRIGIVIEKINVPKATVLYCYGNFTPRSTKGNAVSLPARCNPRVEGNVEESSPGEYKIIFSFQASTAFTTMTLTRDRAFPNYLHYVRSWSQNQIQGSLKKVTP
ncbi:MAG TPA: hypothetical protein VMT62_12890, partial [Syntrophorhabdaceae bacterium]|nr:hypothetical protein [Syntrophorhabdaceae bacterium]